MANNYYVKNQNFDEVTITFENTDIDNNLIWALKKVNDIMKKHNCCYVKLLNALQGNCIYVNAMLLLFNAVIMSRMSNYVTSLRRSHHGIQRSPNYHILPVSR